jgi:hypothetical protein
MNIPPAFSKWGGLALTSLICLAMGFSAFAKLTAQPPVLEMMTTKIGFPADVLLPIGILELVCVALYAFPATSVLGAVLLTGYYGGAITAHVRIHDDFTPLILLGILTWLGIYLREPRLQALLPLRR